MCETGGRHVRLTLQCVVLQPGQQQDDGAQHRLQHVQRETQRWGAERSREKPKGVSAVERRREKAREGERSRKVLVQSTEKYPASAPYPVGLVPGAGRTPTWPMAATHCAPFRRRRGTTQTTRHQKRIRRWRTTWVRWVILNGFATPLTPSDARPTRVAGGLWWVVGFLGRWCFASAPIIDRPPSTWCWRWVTGVTWVKWVTCLTKAKTVTVARRVE